jgi:hypothetical protein
MVSRFYAKTHSPAAVFPLAGLWVLFLPLLLVLFDRLLCILSLLLLLLQIVFPCLRLTGLIRGLHRTRLGNGNRGGEGRHTKSHEQPSSHQPRHRIPLAQPIAAVYIETC